jgi:hypothetical protein
MDNFAWGVAQLDVNKCPEKTLDSLVQKMKEVMGSLERNTVARACKRFRPRMEEMVAAGGDFSE